MFLVLRDIGLCCFPYTQQHIGNYSTATPLPLLGSSDPIHMRGRVSWSLDEVWQFRKLEYYGRIMKQWQWSWLEVMIFSWYYLWSLVFTYWSRYSSCITVNIRLIFAHWQVLWKINPLVTVSETIFIALHNAVTMQTVAQEYKVWPCNCLNSFVSQLSTVFSVLQLKFAQGLSKQSLSWMDWGYMKNNDCYDCYEMWYMNLKYKNTRFN